MSTVRVPCPDCGPTWIPASDVVLTVSPGGASYLFVCECGDRFYRACSESIADMLSPFVYVNAIEPEPHDGPALTTEDYFDFVDALRDPDWIDELA